MATDFDRDDRLHGLLRDTLRSQPATGPCLDAATLAAWTEGALTTEETAAIDAHLAACASCRELAGTLSEMTEAEGAPAAAVVPFTPRPNGRWKVIVGAVGAVAASVLIWVAVRDGSPSPDTTSAANREEVSQARGRGGNVVPPAPAPARPAENASALQPRADAERLRPEAKLARENTARAAEPSQNFAKPSAAPVEPPARATAPPPQTAPPPPAVMPPPPAAPPPAAAGGARSSTVAGLPQSTINIDISGIKNQADLMRSSETFFAIPPIVAEFVAGADLQMSEGRALGAVADRSRAGGAGRGGGGGGGSAVRQEAASAFATPPVQWRLRGPSPFPSFPSFVALSRSTDAGKMWQPVQIEATTPELAAGSAPTNTVCWLVGRAGTVLLSTDGTTFRQVTKPADADLVFVRATDARSATVRTADGRTFVTIDGGTTWTPR